MEEKRLSKKDPYLKALNAVVDVLDPFDRRTQLEILVHVCTNLGEYEYAKQFLAVLEHEPKIVVVESKPPPGFVELNVYVESKNDISSLQVRSDERMMVVKNRVLVLHGHEADIPSEWELRFGGALVDLAQTAGQVAEQIRGAHLHLTRAVKTQEEAVRQLTLIVNGTPFNYECNENLTLKSVKSNVLYQDGIRNQNPDDWEMCDSNGALVDEEATVRTVGTELYVSRRVGHGG